MRTCSRLITLLFLIATGLCAQESEIDRLIANELKMTFPSIYFKHNSTDYASMPYSVDSCFRHIASHFDENLNSLVIWRDSAETEELTTKRIKKLKQALKKYLRTNEFKIYTMDKEQKIPLQTINMTSDSTKINYLLSLNSVFDISKTRVLPKKKKTRRRLVWTGWKTGFHWSTP